MLIKVINEKRENPRSRRDLRRLFLYLFEPKSDEDSPDDRLLGPPELHHLMTRYQPWGAETYLAANELTLQFEEYCKSVTVGRDMPDEWFAHLVFSFAPWSGGNLRSSVDDFKTPYRHLSQSKNAIRIAKDALDFLGWSGERPGLFVSHGDRHHIHVHGVFPVVGHNGPDWDINTHSGENDPLLFEAGKLCSDAFRLNLSTAKLRKYYKKFGALPENEDVLWAKS
jgi:hypothetical protein